MAATSTTPFENPTVISNIVEMISMMILPGACVVTFGLMLHDKKKEKAARKTESADQSLEDRELLYLERWQLSS